VGSLTMRQRSWADWISFKAIASPAACEPRPLVTLVRCLTVVKVDSIGLVVRRCTQCSARQAQERRQLVQVADDPRGSFGEIGSIGGLEGLHRGQCVVLDLGSPDLGEGPLRAWVG
jgi:hypothetical protein